MKQGDSRIRGNDGVGGGLTLELPARAWHEKMAQGAALFRPASLNVERKSWMRAFAGMTGKAAWAAPGFGVWRNCLRWRGIGPICGARSNVRASATPSDRGYATTSSVLAALPDSGSGWFVGPFCNPGLPPELAGF